MRPKHILFVDDEDDIREVAALSLEAIGGWRVSSASDGGRGVAMALAELDVAGTLTKPFDPMTLPDQIAAIRDRAEETP